MAVTIDDSRPTRVVVVEDHAIVREMLVRLLSTQEGVEVVGAAGTISESRAVVENSHPDVVSLDIMLSDGSGIDWARELKAKHPEVGIVFLSALDTPDVVLAAIDTGAEGFLAKSSSCDRLLAAIKAVASGECAFDPSVVAPILRQVAKGQPMLKRDDGVDTKLAGLSTRERQIASLVRKGLSNKEIAQAGSVSINTVKTHLRRIYQHLGVASRRELMQNQSQPN